MQDPRDDFSALVDSEHMFFGLSDPYALIRADLEATLRQNVPDTQVIAIRARGQPKNFTIGKLPGSGRPWWRRALQWLAGTDQLARVTAFAFAMRAEIDVTGGGDAERLQAAVTVIFTRFDEPGRVQRRLFADLHGDAETGFGDEVLKRRLLEARLEAMDP